MLSKTFTALITGISFAGAVLVTSPKQADAHATSVGFENGGAIGTVNVWLGTYNHGGHHLEGSMKLEGVNGTVFYLTVGFSIGAGVGPTPTFDGLSANPATTKPTGLIDGVTNFYIPNFSDPNAALVGTDPGLAGGINHWQGAVFSGLSAGDYQFTWIPAGSPTAEWSVSNNNMNGVFTLEGAVIGISEPATMAVLGFGLIGIGFARKRRAA